MKNEITQFKELTLDQLLSVWEETERLNTPEMPTLRRYTDKDAHGNAVEIAQFVGIDGYNLFTDPARLGTFLPGVASDGLEIIKF